MESVPRYNGTTPEIFTLSPEEIQRFLMRTRREREPAHWEVRLDTQLREILQRANDFVPSAAGSILLDDPRAKLAGATNRLTFIAAFGERAQHLLGQRLPVSRGIAGRIYTTGRPYVSNISSFSPPGSSPLGTGKLCQPHCDCVHSGTPDSYRSGKVCKPVRSAVKAISPFPTESGESGSKAVITGL